MPRLRKRAGGGGCEVLEGGVKTTPVSSSSTSSAARTDKGTDKEFRTPTSAVTNAKGTSENKRAKVVKTLAAVKKDNTLRGGDANAVKKTTAFPERLNWKMTHCILPPTSTPIRDPRAEKFTKEDIESAFGFDDSYEVQEANYSTLLSPIAHASPKGIIPPVWKIHPLSQRNVDPSSKTVNNPSLSVPSSRASRRNVDPSSKKVTNPSPSVPSSNASRRNVDPSSNKVTIPNPSPSVPSSRASRRNVNPSSNKVTIPNPSPSVPSSRASRRNVDPSSNKVTIPNPSPSVPSSRASRRNVDPSSKKVTIPNPSPSAVVPSSPAGHLKSGVKSTAKNVKTKTKKQTSSKLRGKLAVLPEKRPLLFEYTFNSGDKPRHNGISPFSQLLNRYTENPDKEMEGDLYVDPKKIKRTYGSRKRVKFSEERDSETEYDFVPKLIPSSLLQSGYNNNGPGTSSKTSEIKPIKRSKKKKRKAANGDDEDIDEAAKKWLEQKNKEFEDVDKVKLVIELSFSD